MCTKSDISFPSPPPTTSIRISQYWYIYISINRRITTCFNPDILIFYIHSKMPSQLALTCQGKHSDICLQNLCLMFWAAPCLCVVCVGNLMIMKSPNIHPTLKEVKWALSQSYRNVPSALRLFKVLICSGIKTSIKILE